MHPGAPTGYTLVMVQLRRSSLPSLCLALIMGLALAWPDLAHRELHEQREHVHAGLNHGGLASISYQIVASESHPGDHPHLDLTATAPTKTGLPPALAVSEHSPLADSPVILVRVSPGVPTSIQPRGPPSGPPPSTRAPPTA